MYTTNYINTFISVADDCPAEEAEIPPLRGSKKTTARIQYDLISESQYRHTSDDVIFEVFAQKKKIPGEKLTSERETFFSKGQPCMRASALPKRYGWGVHSDEEGRIAIYGIESEKYKTLSRDPGLKQLKAMRSSRA